MKVGGTVVATYTYDALDRRIGVKDNGTQTWTVYDGQNPYADFNGSGTLLTRYVSGPALDELLARTSSGGTTAWYLKDKLGSVRDIVNTSGTVIDHVVYDSYGNVTSETNPTNGDRFKFTGMEWDAAIGQYYDHARWYGAEVGRFTQQDPLGFAPGDVILYRYVWNDPSGQVDNSGLMAEDQDPASAPGANQPELNRPPGQPDTSRRGVPQRPDQGGSNASFGRTNPQKETPTNDAQQSAIREAAAASLNDALAIAEQYQTIAHNPRREAEYNAAIRVIVDNYRSVVNRRKTLNDQSMILQEVLRDKDRKKTVTELLDLMKAVDETQKKYEDLTRLKDRMDRVARQDRYYYQRDHAPKNHAPKNPAPKWPVPV